MAHRRLINLVTNNYPFRGEEDRSIIKIDIIVELIKELEHEGWELIFNKNIYFMKQSYIATNGRDIVKLEYTDECDIWNTVEFSMNIGNFIVYYYNRYYFFQVDDYIMDKLRKYHMKYILVSNLTEVERIVVSLPVKSAYKSN